MKIISTALLFLILISFGTNAQNHILLSGTIENAETNDLIPLAHIYTTPKMIGSISNTKGDFTLRLPMSRKFDTIVFSHIGFETKKIVVDFMSDTNINVSLSPVPIVLPEIIISNITILALFDSLLTHINENYSSKPIMLDAFLRVRGVFNSDPKPFKTGTTLGEFALKIYKNPYADIHNNSNKSQDQVKYVEWQKSDALLLGEENVHWILYSSLLPKSDVLSNLNKSFIYNKKWLKKNNIYIDGIEPYQHGSAYKVVYEQKENVKEKPYKGFFLIDTKSFALVSYERYLIPKGIEYKELKTSIAQMSFKTYEEVFYIRFDYEKIDNKWYLNSVYLINKETKHYANKGIGTIYFMDENENLDEAIVEEYHEATLVMTKLTTRNVKEFGKDELLRLRDMKPFVLTDNNLEFHKKYNTINNSDVWLDRIVSDRIKKMNNSK